jgi:thiol-disulfide isomerase/thioredoxin
MVSLQAAVLALALSGVGQQTVLYDFYADWCGPCRAMDPTIQALIAAGHPVQRVNVDQNKPLAAKFGVQGIPCFVMVVDGRETDRVVGGTTFSRLERMCLATNPQQSREASPVMLAAQGPAASAAPMAPAGFVGKAGVAAAPLWRTSPSGPEIFPVSIQSGGNEVSEARLIAASVRLRVEDRDGHSCGSGTIIDSRGGEALIVTCAHIFRDSQGKGRIDVDLFGPNGPQRVAGKFISSDETRDVGLVSIRTPGPVAAARLAPPGYRISVGQPVISVGCNNGDQPTARRSQVTSLDKFLGPPNIQVAGQPVEGRSGGGLFSTEGLALGVCNAADPSDKEGLYAALGSVYAELDRAELSFIYKSPAESPTGTLPAVATDRLASGELPAMPREMPRGGGLASSGPPLAAEAPAALAPAEQAALEEIRRKLKDGAEVVCVIRSRNNAGAKSEVIMLDRASPEFLKQLAAESRPRDMPYPTSLEIPKPRKPILEWSANEKVERGNGGR